eukprot:706479-Prorocentrum_lima.AAC.1
MRYRDIGNSREERDDKTRKHFEASTATPPDNKQPTGGSAIGERSDICKQRSATGTVGLEQHVCTLGQTPFCCCCRNTKRGGWEKE